ncbi:3-oxoacyl-ACP synthase [Pokkaliibacter plantistimulans]|uniref:3-oxoacyl-ACP synthase n=2 Tax=Pokkaliibacter plantistimulans TaxID=1635171 RepID=A0ABX5LZU6_9GAMM|nr:3-oxoacyl-ACP synthase [Pokkaliibacter plantistimulans]
MVSAAGDSSATALQNACAGKECLTWEDLPGRKGLLPVGRVKGELPCVEAEQAHWHSRNNQLALAALQQMSSQVATAIARFGQTRIGVVIGTSTSGVADNEVALQDWRDDSALPAHFDYRRQELGAPAAFIAQHLQLEGPAYVISTACSSGAKALASARRLLRAGVCDAVIAGGVDSLSQLTIAGFSALESVSEQRCNPFSQRRAGINIGEGAGLFLLSREPARVALLGVGEGSDAHHISAPDPSGAGAERVMRAALADAGLQAAQIGYINLHGTATPLNDSMEAKAVNRVFGAHVPCSSTKPLTGHALGAAGAIEAALCWQLLQQGRAGQTVALPVHLWDGVSDPEMAAIRLVEQGDRGVVDFVLSSSFAFGGNNIALILGRVNEADL